MAGWAVVSTLSCCERFAAEEIRKLELIVYVARFRERFGKHIIEGMMFPGYIFVQNVVDEVEHAVRSARGVHDILKMNGKVCELREERFNLMRAREDREGFIWPWPDIEATKLQADQRVRATAGPVSGLFGVFKGMTAPDRCKVLFSMFGRQTPHNMPVSDLEAA